jgi:hypothetical protein
MRTLGVPDFQSHFSGSDRGAERSGAHLNDDDGIVSFSLFEKTNIVNFD